ncbi:hypothetical protein PVK06_027235 [Gossypium arboreum]|uniref:RNase H type-1 domain-containing protein n=1 Tax=Gossypium arboreum TaxID=29729 RepID=A0ABR0P392_GOSAR|nr:hypothetical protein PVK06_027235 [Gossypium arboreum]
MNDSDEEEAAKVTWGRAAALCEDFQIYNFLERPMLPKLELERGWRKPEQGSVKINFDANTMGRKMCFGLVARDHDGFVLGGRADVLKKNVQAEWAELHALEESISFAVTKNWDKLIFESDCVSLINQLNKAKVDRSTMGYRIREILIRLEQCCNFSFSFVWAPRCCNKVAGLLCSWANEQSCITNFDMDYPSVIHDVILKYAIL